MDNEHISYYIFENEMCRQDVHNKRLFVLCIILFASLILTNGAWFAYESMFEDISTTQTVTQEASGNEISLAGIGDNYGSSKTDGNTNN